METLENSRLTYGGRRRNRVLPAARSREIARAENFGIIQNRWYDSTVGRWLSQDPSGFVAGDANLYRYVGNSPTSATDPSGLGLVDWLDWGSDMVNGYSSVTRQPAGQPEVALTQMDIGIEEVDPHTGIRYMIWRNYRISNLTPDAAGQPSRCHWAEVQYYNVKYKDRFGAVVKTTREVTELHQLGTTEGKVIYDQIGFGSDAPKPAIPKN